MSPAMPDWPADVTYLAGMVLHDSLNLPSVLKQLKDFTPKLLTSAFSPVTPPRLSAGSRVLGDVGVSFPPGGVKRKVKPRISFPRVTAVCPSCAWSAWPGEAPARLSGPSWGSAGFGRPSRIPGPASQPSGAVFPSLLSLLRCELRAGAAPSTSQTGPRPPARVWPRGRARGTLSE